MARTRCLGSQSKDADPISIRIRDNGYQISRVRVGCPVLDLQRELLHLAGRSGPVRPAFPAPCQAQPSAPAIEPGPRKVAAFSCSTKWLPQRILGTLGLKRQGEGIN